MEEIICKDCKKMAPVKKGLCARCYGRHYRKEQRPGDTYPHYESEMAFVQRYFTHNNWVAQPARFKIYVPCGETTTYRPDFYDGERGVFIEVAASRSTYEKNQWKYAQFRRLYPSLTLELRNVDGALCEEKFKAGAPFKRKKDDPEALSFRQRCIEAREWGKLHNPK